MNTRIAPPLLIKPGQSWPAFALFLLALGLTLSNSHTQAANYVWTNAPVDATWTNVLNWTGKVVPGALNSAANADQVIFNSAVTTIGGASNPIQYDNTRSIKTNIFMGPACGAYVLGTNDGVNYLYFVNAGSLLVSNDVVNPITFGGTVRIKLPSSTNGRFDITNNAALATATLTFSNIFNESAATRPLDLWLEGSNPGANTILQIQDNASASGAIQIDKNEAGRWILAGANDLPQKTSAGNLAHVFVGGGTLEVQDPGSLGAITLGNIVVATNGSAPTAILQIDGVTLNNNGVTLGAGGTLLMNGSGTINGVTVGATAGLAATIATATSASVFTLGNAANTLLGGAADTLLHLSGPGTVVFSSASTYAGRWSVDAGTSQVSDPSALGIGANLNINAGAVFDVSPLGPVSYALTTKALSANGTGILVGSTAATIKADPAGTVNLLSRNVNLTYVPTTFAGDVSHPALYIAQGTLSCNGNTITVNNASGTPLGAGTYRLVQQASGNILSSGAFVTLVTGSGLGAGLIAETVASGGNLNMVVSAYTPKSLVWTGTDAANPGVWDRLTSINWLNGATPSTFNIYDGVLFNGTGAANPVVTISATMAPSSVKVDTSATSYTFTGAGQIAGGTSLIKIGAGTLNLATANTYSGGTIISNGVVKLGIDEAISSAGAGDVLLLSPAVIDLNNYTNTINGLNGNGTVDNTGGQSTSILNIGYNDDNGVFSGLIENTTGTVGITKVGNGTETLTTSNNYAGPTVINSGTLRATNFYALGAGQSPVTINAGTLIADTSIVVSNLNGNGGSIINSTAVTNLITVLGGGTSGSFISGKLGLVVSGGTLRLNAANTYSNATLVAGGATLAFGNVGQVGPSGVIASNGASLSMPTVNNPSPGVAANVTTTDGATVTFTSASTGSSYNGQFLGSAIATNIYSGGNMSIGGSLSFSNFLGTVIITNGGVRWFTAANGGDNTTFNFINGGGSFTRDATVVHLGALFGNGSITGPSVTPYGNYWIGAKGINSEYSGAISGSNNIVKVGAANLVLDGVTITTNTDSATFTNLLYSDSLLTYLGTTTVSNGTLTVVVPDNLITSPSVLLASPTAVLDATKMGYVTNYTDSLGNQASALVTNGLMTVVAGQTLGGVGIVKGRVENAGTIAPGYATGGGTLTLTTNLVVDPGATLAFSLSDDVTGLTKSNDLLVVNGSVNLSGAITVAINAFNGAIRPGIYPLIKYTGSLKNDSGVVGNGPVSNLTLGGGYLPAPGTLVLSNTPGALVLVVASNTHNLTWTGDGVTNFWDVATSATFSSSGSPTVFYPLDAVRFDDSSAIANVVLQGSLAPLSIIVSNNVNTYTFGSNGTIVSLTSLVKQGTGALVLTNGANSYVGGTVISNGIVALGGDSAGNQNDLALGTGPVSVNGATAQLKFGGNGGAVVHHFITNPVTLNGGIIRVQDGVQHLTNSTVAVTAAGGSLQTLFATKNLVLDSPLTGTGTLTVSSATNVAAGQVLLNNALNTFNGTLVIVTNGNVTLGAAGAVSNSAAIDVQLGGVFDATARTSNSWTVASGQTLKGTGIVKAGLLNLTNGSSLAPGESGIGTLTITNTTANTATVLFGGTTTLELNRGTTPNSDRIVSATNIFGGTLTVVNTGAALVQGDTFTLFTSLTNRGAFAITNLPALATGLGWSNSLAINGKLTVVVAYTPNPNPTNITSSVANGVLTLAWPADHTGWRLQVQTNGLASGLGTNWVNVAGATTTNQVAIPVNSANGAVFYRLVYP